MKIIKGLRELKALGDLRNHVRAWVPSSSMTFFSFCELWEQEREQVQKFAELR
jgi:hypothetical protein